MASQDAKNFLDAVEKDPRLRDKVKGAFQQVVETARQHGYDVSAKDLSDELHERWGMRHPPDYGHEPGNCFFVR
ncbi:MAG TPA: Nif11-like leader peptide family natural product precursor [Thermoanaerobaculia bacterium]|jgi:predicted ribosomally synthesized peptide with nif11-like leader|nr:Nif11-like leader peptide family natural product precursor [Thermoanaerobaculia bacterium]